MRALCGFAPIAFAVALSLTPRSADAQTVPCGKNTCTSPDVCCNVSCGICAPMFSVCSQQQCASLCGDGFCDATEDAATCPDDCAPDGGSASSDAGSASSDGGSASSDGGSASSDAGGAEANADGGEDGSGVRPDGAESGPGGAPGAGANRPVSYIVGCGCASSSNAAGAWAFAAVLTLASLLRFARPRRAAGVRARGSREL